MRRTNPSAAVIDTTAPGTCPGATQKGTAMPGYYDAPDEFVCPLCKLEDCEGCPGYEKYYDEPNEIWEDSEPADMTRAQAREMDAMILMDADLESLWWNKLI